MGNFCVVAGTSGLMVLRQSHSPSIAPLQAHIDASGAVMRYCRLRCDLGTKPNLGNSSQLSIDLPQQFSLWSDLL